MTIANPYRRTCRAFTNTGTYNDGYRSLYVQHLKYAQSPEHYVRAFLLLLKDMLELFDYIEPADKNLPCYSYRVHELLLRASVEVEANCKAILIENGYSKPGDMNMCDYKKIDASHRLSSYEVRMPHWHGTQKIRRPFSSWTTGASLPWYKAYNATKHDRQQSFELATFEQMIDAMSGLVVLVSSQFYNHDFSPGKTFLGSDDMIRPDRVPNPEVTAN